MNYLERLLILIAGVIMGAGIMAAQIKPCPLPKVVWSETAMCYNSGITTTALKLTYGECKEICKVRERTSAVTKKEKP